MTDPLFKYFATFASANLEINSLWEEIENTENVFTKPSVLSKKEDLISELIFPLNNKQEKKKIFIGIERFKDPSFTLNSSLPHFFLSSGTTAAERSRSYFSDLGMELYRISSLRTFLDVLKLTSNFDPRKFRGISFIPQTAIWKESSLAHMLQFFSQFWPIDFIDPEDIFTYQFPQSPVFIFATAFHYVPLLDSKKSIQLPKGSLIFETGGTKGRTRELTQQELYSGLSDFFSISEEHIISEYGMCELACQAYNFYDLTQKKRFGYRYPFWVNPRIQPGVSLLKTEGSGVLTIYDPFRIDYPYWIRTQDLVDLNEQGFTNIKRAPQSPLKGCSLLVPEKKPTRQSFRFFQASSETLPFKERWKLLDHAWQKTLNDPRFFVAFCEEFTSPMIAHQAIADLSQAFYAHTEKEWEELLNSFLCHENQILLLPHNHSVVGFHPLCLAILKGLNLYIKAPLFSKSYRSAFYVFMENLDKNITKKIHILPDDFSIDHNLEGSAAITVYGRDKTIRFLQQKTSFPIKGFGEIITVAASCNFSEENLSLILKDAFSLAQRGCFSTRLFLTVCPKKEEQKILEQRLQKIAQEKGWCKAPLFPLFTISKKESDNLNHTLSSLSYVLPILCFADKKDLEKALATHPAWGRITTDIQSLSLPKREILALGKTNSSPWGLTHQSTYCFL